MLKYFRYIVILVSYISTICHADSDEKAIQFYLIASSHQPFVDFTSKKASPFYAHKKLFVGGAGFNFQDMFSVEIRYGHFNLQFYSSSYYHDYHDSPDYIYEKSYFTKLENHFANIDFYTFFDSTLVKDLKLIFSAGLNLSYLKIKNCDYSSESSLGVYTKQPQSLLHLEPQFGAGLSCPITDTILLRNMFYFNPGKIHYRTEKPVFSAFKTSFATNLALIFFL